MSLTFKKLPIFPPSLKKGDLIALVFPASYLDEEKPSEILDNKIKWLSAKGYKVILYPQKITPLGYLAGTDKQRAKAFMGAWKDPDVKAIWSFRGGWGSSRMLDFLDYDYIKQNPKIFIGMSDITSLHIAIARKTNLVTFLAPVLNYFGKTDKDNAFDEDFAFEGWEKILVVREKGPFLFPNQITPKVIRSGKAKGRLVGGNLTLISSMCGTKWQLNTDHKILLLEDVDENIDRIDRMLWQLKESNLLKKPAAVILCSWKNCNPYNKYSLTLDEVFEHYFKNANFPVIKDFPSGHDVYQTTVPLNILAEIDTESMRIELLENSVLF